MKTDAHFHESAAKRTYNRWLFRVVAKRYNIVTHLLSFGRDSHWKRWMISRIPARNAPTAVDIASGNGDLAFALINRFPRAQVAGADLTPEMFDLARNNPNRSRISFVRQDMCNLGFKSGSAHIVTGGYALRNAPDLEKALREIKRVLASGGTAAFLDFSKPANSFAAGIEYALLKFWGGLWGLVLHGKPEIYAYIAESLRFFPNRVQLHELLARHGLPVTQSKLFFFGVMEAVVCTADNSRSSPKGD